MNKELRNMSESAQRRQAVKAEMRAKVPELEARVKDLAEQLNAADDPKDKLSLKVKLQTARSELAEHEGDFRGDVARVRDLGTEPRGKKLRGNGTKRSPFEDRALPELQSGEQTVESYFKRQPTIEMPNRAYLIDDETLTTQQKLEELAEAEKKIRAGYEDFLHSISGEFPAEYQQKLLDVSLQSLVRLARRQEEKLRESSEKRKFDLKDSERFEDQAEVQTVESFDRALPLSTPFHDEIRERLRIFLQAAIDLHEAKQEIIGQAAETDDQSSRQNRW